MNIPTQTSDRTRQTNAHGTGQTAINPIDELTVRFEAKDGFPLTGTLFSAKTAPLDPSGPLVLISSATGAPRGFYAAFARELVHAGCLAALTYDYRGMPQSPRPKDWRARINMRDWAHFDMPAAMDFLNDHRQGHAMVGVGQSFGGQALGICRQPQRFERYCMVASLSGYWRGTDTPWQNLVTMNLFGLPITTVLGKTAPWMGLGESIPATVFRDWARWCNHHEYFFDDPDVGARRGYATVRQPILSVGMTDDPWGTPRAVHGLLKHYVNADISERWLSPGDAGGQPIGHLGFFRSRFRESLWPEIIDWIIGGSQTKTTAS
jgi:predicted alpha/beta hydrolase